MIKREEIVVKNRDGALSPDGANFSVLSLFSSHRLAKAKRVTIVIETEEKSLGEVAREVSVMRGRQDPRSRTRPSMPWDQLPEVAHDRWESVAQSVIDAAVARGLVKRV